ncbi:hypothetical protein C1645_876053 [Glomus cerebriforme]|uniref:Uncharacterized protein n=1 Tax=Glomus cerebriforme TaxID=658196 RepID=A0A397T2L7_9GLOM|nr:hypothetical protein C1645_876053 [Glomus cerebriforme]
MPDETCSPPVLETSFGDIFINYFIYVSAANSCGFGISHMTYRSAIKNGPFEKRAFRNVPEGKWGGGVF